MHQPRHDFGGSGPPLHLAVANGFPPATYTPFVAPLLASHRVFSLPPRALWPGIGDPPPRPGTWVTLAEDLLAGWRSEGIARVVAVGHSYGGVASLLAAVRDPGRIAALVLLDPTILPPRTMAQIAEQRLRGEPARFELVEGARRRRNRFRDAVEAFQFWRQRALFKAWPDSTLRLYAESMTRPASEGEGVELTWTGEWEAYYYESFYAETWVEAARLSADIPLLVMAGESSTTLVSEAIAEMRRVWPWATIRTIPGHGHLFPQEMGAEAGTLVAEWLAAVGPQG